MADAFNDEAFTLLSIGVFFIGVRVVARIRSTGLRGLAADDYLMLLVAVLDGLETGAAYSVGAHYKGLANNSMTSEQREILSPDSEEYHLRVDGSKLQLIGWSIYVSLLWTLKTCVCIFYSRMTASLHYMKIRVRIGFGLIFVTYVIAMLSILAGCGPSIEKNWQINPDPGNHCQPAISLINNIGSLVLNVLTDVYLLSIPIPLLWKAQISINQKVFLSILFSGALFIITASILRCVFVLLAGPNGAEEAGSWALRETFVAVVVSNVPILYSLLRGFFTARETSHHGLQMNASDSVAGIEGAVSSPLDHYRRHRQSHNRRSAYAFGSRSMEDVILEEEDLVSKPHWHPYADGQDNTKSLLGARDTSGRSTRIVVATLMTVESEPAEQMTGIDLGCEVGRL